ncbi:MAG: ATP-binding protein [Sediminibacterium sp.]|nr:ATP-binding protein [Sediminibacterium sp.]
MENAIAESHYARSLIEASLDPLVTINTMGKITDMNQATIDITGITRIKLTGTDFFHYFTDAKKASEVYEKIFSEGSVNNYPLTLRHKKGKLTEVLFNGSVYKDNTGNVLGVVIVARDVTEQNRIAKELTASKVVAEVAMGFAEVAKLKAEAATRIAEDSVKAKQQFLSNMSHEIRTPMNAIIGFTKVMLKTELEAKQLEYLKAIKLSGDSLIVLINDILDLAKVDAGKMKFEEIPFKMATSISAMLHLFEPKIEEKNLQLIKEYDNRIPEVLLGDSVRINQIILNLISNSVKFTNTGKIRVSVKLVTEDETSVQIEFAVSDDGIGIPKDKIANIFENFNQATTGTSRIYGGTGLGLAIVKQLVQGQGGTYKVESEEGIGSTFSFCIKFSKTTALVESELEIIKPYIEVKNIHILVVEDILLNQLLMKTLLDDFGFECDIASNGKIAIDKMQEKNYDIVLMDLQMPIMNGFETTEFIRKKMNSLIPIIALTADVTTVDLAKCKLVGMNDYLAKPVNEKLLYNKIIAHIKTAKNRQPQLELNTKPLSGVLCTDLTYLKKRTKSDTSLMIEMISLFLEQTPILISSMKSSLSSQDWQTLQASVHKIIPSFSIMGISEDFEVMAKQIKEYAQTIEKTASIPLLLTKIENVCIQAYSELEIELKLLKK